MMRTPHRHAGFTLMEMVISLVVLGLLSVVMLPLLSLPATAYMDAKRRVDIQNQLDLIKSKLADDLQYALPGSLRRTNVGLVQYLEYLEIRAYGRYRNDGACAAPSFATGCSISTFDTLGPLTYLPWASGVVPNRDFVTVLSDSVSPYKTAAGQKPRSRLVAAVPGANGVRLTFLANTFPSVVPGASKRVYIVVQPVTYRCTPATGRLEKFAGYNLSQNQPTAFGGMVPAQVSDAVSQCLINVDPLPSPTPTAAPAMLKSVVSVSLRLTRSTPGQPSDSIDGFIQIGVREP